MNIQKQIKDQIVERLFLGMAWCIALCVLTWTQALASTSRLADQRQIDPVQIIETLIESGANIDSSSWKALTELQANLYRAMALDPGPGVMVPPSQVPKALFAAELNQELSQQLDKIKNSTLPRDARAQFEFDQYIQVANQILNMRKARQFPAARSLAKRGALEKSYQALTFKIKSHAAALPNATEQLTSVLGALKDAQNATVKSDATKAGVFGIGSSFIWFTAIGVFGFLLGIKAHRFNPESVQKAVNEAVVGGTKAKEKNLDYVQWLKDFENILSRFKSSQLSQERRISEILSQSERISQSALSLYTDARIKNEANLEARMAGLIREIQGQLDQSQKLQTGDRVQMQSILEHCLRLCDAIEHDSVHLDQRRLAALSGVAAGTAAASVPQPVNARVSSQSNDIST